MKSRKNREFLSNYDIQKIYLNNEGSASDKWMHNLFKKVNFIAISRIKKYKNILGKDDLLQSLYFAMWQAIKTFDPHKNFDFYRWLSWHLNKEVRNFKKANSRFYSINVLTTGTSNTINLEDKMILLKDILDCSEAISERDSRIIYSCFFEGRTLSEVAEGEGLSVEGVRKIKNKTLLKLRRILIVGEY